MPLYYLAKPGQPTPYNWYPYMALGVIVLAIDLRDVSRRRDPGIGERVGRSSPTSSAREQLGFTR